MMRRFLTIFISSLFLIAAPAYAKMIEYENTDAGWHIYRSDDGQICSAVVDYAKGDIAGFMTGSDGSTYLMFSDPKVTSLKDDETVKLDLYFIDNKNNLDDGWGSIKFTASHYDDRIMMLSQKLNKQVLNDLSRNELWSVMRDDKVVESYSLNGSSEAVDIVERCIGWNPKDPFLT